MLMAICSIEQRAGRTNLNAVTALRTVQPAAVRSNDRACAAIAGLDRLLAHPFIAHARATLAKDAALRIVGDHRGKIFFRMIVLLLGEALFKVTPIESLLLQFTFATAITHGAIER